MVKNIHAFLSKDDDEELSSNTFVVIFTNNDALIVDPSFLNKALIRFINEEKLNLIGILLTHGHYDHFKGLPILLKKYHQLPVYIGKDDQIQLLDPVLNCSSLSKDPREHLRILHPSIGLIEGPVQIHDHQFQVLDTPFHTLGGVCYYFPEAKALFSGDSVMENSIGRFDLKHAAPRSTKASILKIFDLDDDVKLYPGHGPLTSILNEKTNNPYVKRFLESKH